MMKKTMKTMLAALMVLALMIGAAVPTLAESMLDTESMFTDRDLNNEPDLSDAVYYTLSDGEDIHITEAGIYVLNGSADNVTVYVEAGDEDKVQIVLSSVTIINEDMPAIWVKTADKVFVTVAADSTLKVTGSFQTVDGTKLDGVIFSKQDLTLNGTAQLTISSTKHGILAYDAEATYKIVYNGSGSAEIFVNGSSKGTVTVDFTGGKFTVILGNVPGKSSAYVWQNVENTNSYLHKLKFTYN